MARATHLLRSGISHPLSHPFRILIALIYAKSLYLQRDYVRCFELL